MMDCNASSSSDSLILERRVFSSFRTSSSRVLEGYISTDVLCMLFKSKSLTISWKTALPSLAIRSFNSARGSSNLSASVGSRSYIHSLMVPSMRLSPLGNEPVLNSLMSNSIVFIEAAMASSENPSSATLVRVSTISSSTLSTFSGFTPLSPTEKTPWRSSFIRPPPVMASPSPDSISVLRRMLDEVPISMWSRIVAVISSLGVSGSSFTSQLSMIMCVSLSSPPLSLTG
mmetsp:Transcript_15693/g.35901  ORF Transcript_15693/g.35901 Transcript_15693/m.35901 type:complete len:230 (-) Transcript_15693:1023-1712(-)